MAETALRVAGYSPWQPRHNPYNLPQLFEPDPELGWTNKPGVYKIDGNAPNFDIPFTILADQSRLTGLNPDPTAPQIILVGGSFTNGDKFLPDEQTFAWKLQVQFPETAVLNHGVPGYGSYQSLLLSERLLAELENPSILLYGFLNFHEFRNIDHWQWLRGLTTASDTPPAIPYALLDEAGNLERHPPERYPHWPLREYSAVITLLEQTYAALRAVGRTAQAEAVTVKTLQEMTQLAENHNLEFRAVYLHSHAEPKERYLSLLEAANVPVIDCVYPGKNIERFRLPEDNHPNAELNEYWANCIAQGIQNIVP